MSLVELIDNSLTDKNTVHSYLELYETLLSKKKYTAKNILEVGLGDFQDKNGGSIKLWRDYFPNATIYGLDILPVERVIDELIKSDRVILYNQVNAYDEHFFTTQLLSKNIKFDMVLDDGPHTLDSMISFIRLYSQLLADDGILIVEDVQSYDWLEHLKNAVPEELKKFIQINDLRGNKNRYDDVVFVINKSI